MDALWNQLEGLRPNRDKAWVLGGDFNVITSVTERMGGSCHRDGVSARCVGNDEWWNIWSDTQVRHLNRVGLDHRSILLVTKPSTLPLRKSSFKYLAAWQSHRGFEEIFSAAWKPGDSIVRNIGNFQLAAGKWNKNSFGHIGHCKHVLIARIRGIEHVNESSSVPYLQELENSLKDELNEVLWQEDVL
ncbi:hypothetical protein V6N13_004556 [Hibiscus sabdariffa]